MKKNILMSVLLLLMGITVYAQEDFQNLQQQLQSLKMLINIR